MHIKVGFLGCGNIGAGVYHLLEEMKDQILHREGLTVEVRRILVRDTAKLRKYQIPPELFTSDPSDVLEDDQISLVLEFMGGEQPAAEYLLKALANQKTVITANKNVVATHWLELQQEAQKNKVGLYYEASVAGGIPIVRALSDSLQANHIRLVCGIINGTTNFMLDLIAGGKTYAEALTQAQQLGLAEPDPTYDVSGMDAAYKLSILATLAFHSRIPVDSISVTGIERLQTEDVQAAKALGYRVKLLVVAKRKGQQVEARVRPALVPEQHPLASVNGAFNAVYLHGSAVGPMMLYGQGAGEQPTASAMVSDLIVAASTRQHQYPTFQNQQGLPEDLVVLEDWSSRYYVRLTAEDKPGVMAALAAALAQQGISISSIVQREGSQIDAGNAEIQILTHKCQELSMRKALESLAALSGVKCVNAWISVEDMEETQG